MRPCDPTRGAFSKSIISQLWSQVPLNSIGNNGTCDQIWLWETLAWLVLSSIKTKPKIALVKPDSLLMLVVDLC